LLVVELEDDEDEDFRIKSCREVYVLEKPIWRLKMPSVVPWLQGETKQGEIEQQPAGKGMSHARRVGYRSYLLSTTKQQRSVHLSNSSP